MGELYKGSIIGFEVIGYSGGANGNFLRIIFLDKSHNKVYGANVNSLGKIYFSPESNYTRKRDSITGSIITSVNEAYPEGSYFGFTLLKDGKTYIAESEYDSPIIQVKPVGIKHTSNADNRMDYAEYLESLATRRKTIVKPKTIKKSIKRKPIKKCSCVKRK